MKNKKKISQIPVLLTGLALIGFCPMGSTALAQETIKPSGGWQVTKVQQQRSGPFCALTQHYQNNMIVTLGRNMTEEYSLAVDFQKNRLDPDRSYTVTLRPGPGQTRSMELMPISERAIVMRLGWDESFFEALNVSQTLGFEVDGERFNFNLPEIRSGQQDLKACIDGIKDSAPSKMDILNAQAGKAAKGFDAKRAVSPAAPEEVKTALSALPEKNVDVPRAIPPGQGQEALAAQNPDLLKQIASLRDENKDLRTRLGEQQKRFDAAFKNSAQSNEAQELREKVKLLEKENASLKAAPKPEIKPDPALAVSQDEALEKMRARFNEAEEEVSRLGQMLQKERQEKTDLQEKLVKAEAKAPKLAKGQPDPQTLQKTLVERTSELERVRKELSDTKRKSEKQAEQIAAFEKDAKSGDDKAQNKVLSKQLADMTKERDKALMQVETLQSAQEKLNARLASLQQEKDQGKAATTELASLKSRLENVTAQLRTQEDENKKIKSDLSAMQNTAARREAKIVELQKQTDQAVEEAEKAKAARVAAAAVPEPVPQRQPVERITPAAAPMPTVRTSAETKTAANVAKPAFGQQDLQAALQRAGLGAHGLSSSHGGQVLTWKTSAGLTGEADIQPSNAGDFGVLVEKHISAQRSKCNGDFAAMPSGQGSGRAQYELACVGSNGGFASSLLFVEKEGQFIAIAHNAAPENMNGAMDARDRVATSLQ